MGREVTSRRNFGRKLYGGDGGAAAGADERSTGTIFVFRCRSFMWQEPRRRTPKARRRLVGALGARAAGARASFNYLGRYGKQFIWRRAPRNTHKTRQTSVIISPSYPPGPDARSRWKCAIIHLRINGRGPGRPRGPGPRWAPRGSTSSTTDRRRLIT
ncbi:hypothetical protein EVAR_68702_1 [Eumeta japonica]|uniref:Uncharacterized protein n=1 Tax=Eumeta variegata TaxID=151549 RepID=A0A4C2A1W1_EUMVA|nr:hypothetical protein EVAR_68702_1 [Eumeta japonica]